MGNNDMTVVFSQKSYKVDNLMNFIESGTIALPELQRPFVWDSIKARDFIDSLYKGLPAGFIVLWDIYEANGFKPINLDQKSSPKYLVVDGQQRLTSLFSIIKNKKVLMKNGHEIKIKISFNPLEEKFEVCNPAIEKDVRWIPDITEVFIKPSTFNFITDYFQKLKEKQIEFDLDLVSKRIERLKNIITYDFSVMELSNDLNPEQVSEIFVRINSKGQKLNQSDFILTLMSVYWQEGKKQLESFCQNNSEASKNLIGLEPLPEQLVRTIVGLAFRRGRLNYAYLTLKGRDFENKIIDEALREKNFDKLKDAQSKALNLSNWFDFIKIIHSSGFITEKMISSKVAFFVCYCIYLFGKEYKIDYKELETSIAKWFVMSLISQRYTGSFESQVEDDLKNIQKENFLNFIDEQIRINLTEDFWTIQLPEKLKTSSNLNFAYLTYLASLVKSNTKIIFSNVYLKDYLSQPHIKKQTLDIHHIFPKNFLKKKGKNRKEINQVANLIYIEYKDNLRIKDKQPREYFPELVEKYEKGEFERIYSIYDLPPNFYELDYKEFLEKRRILMAKKIRAYFENLNYF